jgi:hypothetical protein
MDLTPPMMLYTVDHANRALPYVRRIVEDIVAEHQRWQEAIVELDILGASTNIESPDPRGAELERRIQRLARDIEGYQSELDQIGVQLKDRRIGLVDFPSEMDGRPVLLCWRLGEPSVQYWHDIDSGFAGRQPLSPTLVG